jgi:broad specificity phosphatase PhoE
VEQAVLAGHLLQPFGITAVVSSDLRRARATAAAIALALGLECPLATCTALAEYDLGAWSGLTRLEIEAGWPGAIEEWRHGRLFATPGGERRADFVARISSGAAQVAADHPGETVLVVTHGGVIGALSRSLGGPVRRFGHLCGLWIDVLPSGLRAGAVVSLLGPDPAVTDSSEGTELAPAETSEVLDTPAR